MWTSARDDGVVEVYVSLTGSGLELVKPAVHNVFLRSLWGVMHTFIDGVRSVSDRDLSAWLFNTEWTMQCVCDVHHYLKRIYDIYDILM